MKRVIRNFYTICLIVAMVLVAVSCGGGASTPSEKALEMVEYLQNGDYEGYIDALHYDEPITEQERSEYIVLYTQKGAMMFDSGIDSFEVVSEKLSEDGNSAEVEMTITLKNGKVMDDASFNFVKIDGEWFSTH